MNMNADKRKDPNALVVLSGGQDSATCLAWALEQFENVRAISFDYGQRHRIELEQARKMVDLVNVPYDVINVEGILIGTSPLTNPDIDVEKYKDAESLPGGLEKTFVPGRNILFMSIAGSRGYVYFNGEAFAIITGVSQEDFGGYPDCREDFIQSMEATLNEGLYLLEDNSEFQIEIVTPLIDLNKKQTVELAQSLQLGMELVALSHTCYDGVRSSINDQGERQVGCGKCHSCLLRSRGFEEAGIEDPALAVINSTPSAG